MTNLDSILKNRDITLLTKIRIIKDMVFPVAMYGCESWTIKKTEHQRIDALQLWCWRVSDSKEIKPVIVLKLTVLKLKLQNFVHMMQRTDSLENTLMIGEDQRQEEKETTENEMAGWHHWLNGHEFEQAQGVGDGQEAWRAAVHGVAKRWTQLRHWTELIVMLKLAFLWITYSMLITLYYILYNYLIVFLLFDWAMQNEVS